MGVAYEIYLSGCKGYCTGCYNSHLFDFDEGILLTDLQVVRLVEDIHQKRCNTIVILGGEPLDQNLDEFIKFIELLKLEFPSKEFYLYTHYLPEILVSNYPEVFNLFHYIKCGEYVESLLNLEGTKDPVTGLVLASTNQFFIDTKKYKICKKDEVN